MVFKIFDGLIDKSQEKVYARMVRIKHLKKGIDLFFVKNISASREIGPLKVHKHENFFLTFFAETETLWSQGPVTRDF